jgi:hypothetical protein
MTYSVTISLFSKYTQSKNVTTAHLGFCNVTLSSFLEFSFLEQGLAAFPSLLEFLLIKTVTALCPRLQR